MPVQPTFLTNSRPFEISRIEDATQAEAGVMTPDQVKKLDAAPDFGQATDGQIPIGKTGSKPELSVPFGANGIDVAAGPGTLTFGLSPINTGEVLYNSNPGMASPQGVNLIELLSSKGIGPSLDYILDTSAPVTEAPVYNTLVDLFAAVADGPAVARVYFQQDVTIDEEWAYPGELTLLGVKNGTPITLTFGPNATLKGAFPTFGASLQAVFLNTAPCLVPNGGANVLIVVEGATLARQGSAPLYDVPDGDTAIYAVWNSPTQNVTSTQPVFNGLGVNATMIGVQFQAGPAGGIASGDFSGAGNVQLLTGIDGSVLNASDFPWASAFAQLFTAQPENFGPWASGVVLGVPPAALPGTRPYPVPIDQMISPPELNMAGRLTLGGGSSDALLTFDGVVASAPLLPQACFKIGSSRVVSDVFISWEAFDGPSDPNKTLSVQLLIDNGGSLNPSTPLDPIVLNNGGGSSALPITPTVLSPGCTLIAHVFLSGTSVAYNAPISLVLR